MLNLMPHLHKNRIRVGRSKLHGSMLSLSFDSCSAVIYLQLQVGPIIIWLVIGGVACLEDKWGYVVGSHNMCGPIIEVAFMSVKEDGLGVHLASSTGPTEETRCLHTDIPVHIYLWRIVD